MPESKNNEGVFISKTGGGKAKMHSWPALATCATGAL